MCCGRCSMMLGVPGQSDAPGKIRQHSFHRRSADGRSRFCRLRISPTLGKRKPRKLKRALENSESFSPSPLERLLRILNPLSPGMCLLKAGRTGFTLKIEIPIRLLLQVRFSMRLSGACPTRCSEGAPTCGASMQASPEEAHGTCVYERDGSIFDSF